MPKGVKELLIKAGLVLAPFLGGTILTVAARLLPADILQEINLQTWAQLVAGLSLLSIYLFACCLLLYRELKKKPNFKPYIYNQDKGYWQHKGAEDKICAACKLDGALSPLHVYRNGWRCPKHQTTIGREEVETVLSPGNNYHMT